jgi:quinol monooxygenase YgiN|tara:strand:+ start:135 stop:437 length:303 start_codon:yes stop_codon:yes gene_type:complete
MIAVIIKFKVKPNQTKIFVDSWKQLTEFIYKYENSLGSRLHKENDLNFIAYAQWPDKEILHNSGSKLPQEALEVRQRMRDACEKVEKLFELELTEDLLKK